MTYCEVMMTQDKNKIDSTYLDNCIKDIANGQLDGLEKLYISTSHAVFGYALSILNNYDEAQDVVQDCYLHIHKSSPGYKSNGKPLAWIMKITRNLCLERIRKGSFIAPNELEDWMAIDKQEGLSPAEKITLRECLQTLTKEEREIVMLHATSGFKHREIADITGKSLAFVLSKYNRAIKKLKAAMKIGGF